MRPSSARLIAAIVALLALAAPHLEAQTPRAITPSDAYRLRNVRSPQVSPDGQWVAFTVSSVDSTKDRRNSDIYMVSWDGSRTLRLTSSTDNETDPRWSPDGRYLSFTSARQGSESSQLWLLDRSGGEAQRISDFDEGVSDYVWSPDGSRIVVVSQDVDSAAKADSTRPRPIVIDRYLVKRDGDGWLDRRRTHLYLLEVASKAVVQLTRGDADDREPAWSPDGQRIVFTSARHTDEDRSDETDLYLVETRAGAEPQRLTSSPSYERSASFSPDGRWIAFIQGTFTPVPMYGTPRVAVMPASGGTPRVLAPSLDRPQSAPLWTADGAALLTFIDDDRISPLLRIAVADGAITRLVEGRRVVEDQHTAAGRVALLVSDVATPSEIFALDGDSLRRLTRENDAWRAEVRIAAVEAFTARSRDGTMVNGLLTRALDADPSKPHRTVLWIHGGPVAQNDYSFWLEKEAMAAAGWNVLQMNYRGSSGRGEAFQRAIYADWCGKEVEDLLASVDEAVRRGIADPQQLAVGGWSYGGILTDCLIASTTRFKAAISGAGSSLFTSMYGSDQYPAQYDAELGPPWKNPRLWEKVSYAFWRAERIKTPTLFMGGADDFNVPIAGSEQMYLALRTQDIPTQLVVYPGQNHGITRPSFVVDRVQRWIDWMERYVPRAVPAADAASRASELLAADRAFGSQAGTRGFRDGLAAMLADDAVMPAPTGFVEGREAVLATLLRDTLNARSTLRWSPERAGVSGDGTQGLTIGVMQVTRADGRVSEYKYLAYWQRGAEGWRARVWRRVPRPAGATSAATAAAPWLPRAPAGTAAAGGALAAPLTAEAHARELQRLIAMERLFSDSAAAIGIGPAFEALGADDAWHLGGPQDREFNKGNRVIARAVQGDAPAGSSPVTWSAERAILAPSGDLGVTLGYIVPNAAQPDGSRRGFPFFTIWRREPAGWKYIAE